MDMLLAFAPFIVYMILGRSLGITDGLSAAALTGLAMVIYGAWNKRSLKVLEVGTVLLFGGLALYSHLFASHWQIPDVRLRIDGGLALVVLISIAIRRPFTLQYAREHCAPEIWSDPGFIRSNNVISGVWAIAFILMVAADLAMIYLPGLGRNIPIVVTVGAMYLAIKFTKWYPEHLRRQREAVEPGH